MAYLQESLYETGWESFVSSEVLFFEVSHDMSGLLPEIHRLLSCEKKTKVNNAIRASSGLSPWLS